MHHNIRGFPRGSDIKESACKVGDLVSIILYRNIVLVLSLFGSIALKEFYECQVDKKQSILSLVYVYVVVTVYSLSHV